MDIASLTPAILTELIPLLEKRQSLAKQIEQIDADLNAVFNGKSVKVKEVKAEKKPTAEQKKASPSKVASTPKAARAPKSGPLKDRLIPILQAAGSDGVTVPDLAAALQISPSSAHVWFATTGRKETSIQRVGRGRYAWKPLADAAAVVETISEPASSVETSEVVLEAAPASETPAFSEFASN